MGADAEVSRGPDPIVVRLPRDGGSVRAYLYPKLDSVIWTGRTSSVDRVLGFDPEGGALAIVDAKGRPARVDFRLGDFDTATRAKLASLTSTTGTDIFGLDDKGSVVRLTRAGDWTFTPPFPARSIFPQNDGSLLVSARKGGETTIWKLFPPETTIQDTVVLPITSEGARSQVGDRVYFATDTALVGVRARDLAVVPSIRIAGRPIALAPTPSGDRIYVALAADSAVAIVNRYTDQVASTIHLPGVVRDLRMDRLGRYVLGRPARGDSAWVIAIATNRLVGSVQTRWTDDLPTVAPDGAIAINTGHDVVFLDGETLQAVRTISGGATDYWYFMFWNGFRPRAAGVDEPVSFAVQVSIALADSVARAAAAGSTAVAAVPPESSVVAPQTVPPAPPTTPVRVPPPQAPARPPAAEPFTVSFAALLNEQRARALADSIVVEGARAQVVASQRAGVAIYRVVLGPYPDRAAAERIGRESKRSYWVFPGHP
jgi:hypothetical protein